MKKILMLAIMAAMLAVSGCGEVSDLVGNGADSSEAPVMTPIPTPVPTPEPSEEPLSKIAISNNLKMNNEWTIMGDFEYKLTGKKAKDRIVLGTTAKEKSGEMVWDDSQYWTLAVISEEGAYNLFSQRISGYVYAEVNEIYKRGVATPVVTAYIFSGTDREIRNYSFDGEMFVEEQVFNTREFSTGGINNMYSSIPEPEAE